MTMENLARSYYRLVNAKDLDGIVELFTDDAIMVLPDGREMVGKQALRGMYAHTFEHGGPQPKPARIVPGTENAAVEVEVTLADGTVLHMASFFYADSHGKLERVAVYKRG